MEMSWTDGVVNVDINAISVVADDLLDDTSEAVHALGSDTSPDGQQQMRVLSEMGLPTNSSPLNDVETDDAISDRRPALEFIPEVPVISPSVEETTLYLLNNGPGSSIPPLVEALYWAIQTASDVHGLQETYDVIQFGFRCAIERSQMSAPLTQPFAEAPIVPLSNFPPPYEEVLSSTQTEPQPPETVAPVSEARPVACRFGDDCYAIFTGTESTAAIRQHLEVDHGVELHPDQSQPVRCPWRTEDGIRCSATIRRSGLAKHLRDVHMHVGAMTCERCGKRLSREDAFRRHLLRCNGSPDRLTFADGN